MAETFVWCWFQLIIGRWSATTVTLSLGNVSETLTWKYFIGNSLIFSWWCWFQLIIGRWSATTVRERTFQKHRILTWKYFRFQTVEQSKMIGWGKKSSLKVINTSNQLIIGRWSAKTERERTVSLGNVSETLTWKYSYWEWFNIFMEHFMCGDVGSNLYSLVHLVWPNTESLISQPFMGLSKIRLLLQDPEGPRYVRFFWRYHIFHLLFCPTHAHIIRASMGVYSRICSEAGRLDLFAEKATGSSIDP